MSAVPMIGRSAEFGQAERFLDDLPGGSRCLLLEGEVGIGKTTLLNQARASATDRGYRVLSASPVEIYVRTDPTSVAAVAAVLPATADPPAPQNVSVADPTDALVARAEASAAFQSLFLALGGVAQLVGGVGIANVMVIVVLERRGEIGLRRALGATRRQIGVQFVAEAGLLALSGGTIGAVLGGFATTVYSAARHWSTVVPRDALVGAVGLALAVGVVAGLYPAIRATRLSPTEALRTI